MIGFANEASENPRLVEISISCERHTWDNIGYIGDGQMKEITLGDVR